MNDRLAAMPNPEKVKLLEFADSIWLQDILLFIAKDNFKIENSPPAKVSIAKMSDNFISEFLPLRDVGTNGRHLNTWELKKTARDQSIINELGQANYETKIVDLWQLLQMQPNGGPGLLLTNGKANMFYIRSKSGDVWVVRARFQSGNKAWHIDTYSTHDHLPWGSGRYFIARG